MLPAVTPATMSSREIAELTGKEHRNVTVDIRKMLVEAEKDVLTFQHTYLDSQNREQIEFRLDRDLTDLLLTGYSVPLRLKVIVRWRELEFKLAPALPDFTNPVAAARAWADAMESQAATQLALEAARPAVEFVDRFVTAKSAKGFREVAKILGVKEREFIADLAAHHIIFKQGSNWLPFAEHQHAGRMVVKTGEASGHTYTQCRFTPEGIAWIAKRYSRPAAAVLQ